MDLILLLIFCYQLHKLAVEKGLSPWPYILNYVAAFFLVGITVYTILISAFGKDFWQNPKIVTSVLTVESFALMFEVFFFIYLRRRIQKVKVMNDEEEDERPNTPPPGPKKDLSYFR